MMDSNRFQILAECLLVTLYFTTFFEPVLMATCFIDLITKHLSSQDYIPQNSKEEELVKSEDFTINKDDDDDNSNLKNDTSEVYIEESLDNFSAPVVHDIDDDHLQQPLPVLTKPDFISESEWFDETRVLAKGKELEAKHPNWKFLENRLRELSFDGDSYRVSVAVLICCFLFITFIHCAVELYSLRRKISAMVKKETQVIKTLCMKEKQTQTCSDALSVRDEISTVKEMMKIFSHIKKLSIKMKSLESTKEDAERYLTDEILHLIASRIARVEFMKNNIDMLYPDVLIRLGKMYEKFVKESATIETTMANNENGENIRSLNINLGVLIDNTGKIKQTSSELQEAVCSNNNEIYI